MGTKKSKLVLYALQIHLATLGMLQNSQFCDSTRQELTIHLRLVLPMMWCLGKTPPRLGFS